MSAATALVHDYWGSDELSARPNTTSGIVFGRGNPASVGTLPSVRLQAWNEERIVAERKSNWTRFTSDCVSLVQAAAVEGCSAEAFQRLLAASRDCAVFQLVFSPLIDPPNIAAADDGELVLSWRRGDRRAVASLPGNGLMGFTMLVDNRFVPGIDVALDESAAAPRTLVEYLT